jgi:hypothetical protein
VGTPPSVRSFTAIVIGTGNHLGLFSQRCQSTPVVSRRPLPTERHNKKLVFPSNYTHGFGPGKGTLIDFDSPGLAFLQVRDNSN